MQRLGVVGGLAVAVGAGDEQEVFFGREFGQIGLRQVEDGGGEAAFSGFLGGFFRESLGGAGLGTEKDRQRLEGR